MRSKRGWLYGGSNINPGTRAGRDIFAFSKEYGRGVFFVPPILKVYCPSRWIWQKVVSTDKPLLKGETQTFSVISA